MKYHVELAIDIEADSPQEAATLARRHVAGRSCDVLVYRADDVKHPVSGGHFSGDDIAG